MVINVGGDEQGDVGGGSIGSGSGNRGGVGGGIGGEVRGGISKVKYEVVSVVSGCGNSGAVSDESCDV